jgi:hypothetical protein
MPSGGPQDRTPPVLVSSEPAPDSVNVRTDRLAVRFNKPVDEVSFRRALSIAPDFDQPPTIVARGALVEVRFPEPLRENTTYIVTLGSEMRDLRGNRLPAPITIAFATGPQLDQGELNGWVRDPVSGRGVASVNLFAYALPAGADSLPDPRRTAPDYRTETDSRGEFRLSYLRDTPFFVVAIDDRNRNRRADAGEPFAVPADPSIRPTFPEDTVSVPPLALFITTVDTLRPDLVRVRPATDQRFAVRFSETVRIVDRDPSAFALTDSASGAPVPVLDFFPDTDPNQIVVRTAPMQPAVHRLALTSPTAVADTAGNLVRPGTLTFVPPVQPDTARARLASFLPPGADTLRLLRPGEHPGVRFSEPPRVPPAGDRIEVRTPAGERVPASVTTDDGLRYRILSEVTGPFDVLVRQPDSLYTMRFSPLAADSLGDLSGTVVDIPAGATAVVELRPASGDVVFQQAGPDGSFLFRGLPPGETVIRVFADVRGSTQWDGGLLAPYRPSEPLRVLPPVRVRARWETELEPISLDPAAVAPPPPAPAGDSVVGAPGQASPRDPRLPLGRIP